MPDQLIKAMAADGRIRVVAAITTDLVEEARRRHQTSPTATAALGKALTGGLLLSQALLKDRGTLTVRIIGKGPLGGILVDAKADGAIRGYVAHPDIHIPPTEQGSFDVGGAVGRDGTLSVTLDTGTGTPFSGTVELLSGELSDDFTHYMATSQQTPSAISLGFFMGREGHVEAAGGLMVQLMPGAGDEIAWRLEQAIRELPALTELIRRNQSLDQIVEIALKGFAVEVLERSDRPRFQCQCSEDRVIRAIASLGPTEIQSIIDEDGKAEVRCHFCNEEYLLSRKQLEDLLAS
ncbi:33 kDa chaperonin [compost metagenome]